MAILSEVKKIRTTNLVGQFIAQLGEKRRISQNAGTRRLRRNV